jgi:short-chain 2-methylacyl-CoA dehydrogenase
VVEEIARIDPSIAILVDIHNTLTINAIRTWGTEQQQEQWLSRLATDTVSAFCLSESTSGSDAFALQTTATISPDQSYYILNGTKSWISNAQQAGVFIVFANVNPNELGYKGITAFIVDATTSTSGITIGKPENKLGLRASSTCQVIFDHVKVDASCVLGEVGMGYKYCIQILNEGRIGIAAQQLGIAKACLYDIALPYMMERKQFNQSIASFQGMQHQYALAATEIHAAETMIYNACRLKEQNMNFVKEASMCKYYAANVAERTASKTIEWLGGIGYTKDMLAEKFYRDCKVGSIYEGTSNIQLQTIAKLLMSEYRK